MSSINSCNLAFRFPAAAPGATPLLFSDEASATGPDVTPLVAEGRSAISASAAQSLVSEGALASTGSVALALLSDSAFAAAAGGTLSLRADAASAASAGAPPSSPSEGATAASAGVPPSSPSEGAFAVRARATPCLPLGGASAASAEATPSLPLGGAYAASQGATPSLPLGGAYAASQGATPSLPREGAFAVRVEATSSLLPDGASAAAAGAPRGAPPVVSMEPLILSTPSRDSSKPRYAQDLSARLKTTFEENTIDYPRHFYTNNPHDLLLPLEEPTYAYIRITNFHKTDFRKNYPHIKRCLCPKVSIIRRTELENDVAVRINRTVKNKNEEIVIGTVGFGGLLGELRLLIKLNEYGFTKFRIIGFEQNPVKIMTIHKSEIHGGSEYDEVDLRVLSTQFIKFFHDHYPEIEITMILPPISTEERDDDTNLQLGRSLSTYFDQYRPHAILLVDLLGEKINIGREEQRKEACLLKYCIQQIHPKLKGESFIAFTTILKNLDCSRFITRYTPVDYT